MALSKEEMRLYQRERRAKLRVKDTGCGCSVCGQKPVVNVEGTYWMCGGCVKEKLAEMEELKRTHSVVLVAKKIPEKPKVQDWRKDKVVGCRKFGE
jgi:hypothetical protein